MPWQLDEHPHRVFPRNPLVAVIVDLRFSPILKVGKGIPDFQDLVRDRLPAFQEDVARVVNIQPMGGIEVREEKVFAFVRETTKLTLTSGSLSIEARGHTSREELFRDFTLGLTALQETFAPIHPQRLGLRYVNIIDKRKHSPGREVEWSELIRTPYISEPTGKASEQSLFSVEVTSSVGQSGDLTLRYGLIPEPTLKVPVFRLDADRYSDRDVTMSGIPSLLLKFSDDIFCNFRMFAGPALIEWMEGEG